MVPELLFSIQWNCHCFWSDLAARSSSACLDRHVRIVQPQCIGAAAMEQILLLNSMSISEDLYVRAVRMCTSTYDVIWPSAPGPFAAAI